MRWGHQVPGGWCWWAEVPGLVAAGPEPEEVCGEPPTHLRETSGHTGSRMVSQL